MRDREKKMQMTRSTSHHTRKFRLVVFWVHQWLLVGTLCAGQGSSIVTNGLQVWFRASTGINDGVSSQGCVISNWVAEGDSAVTVTQDIVSQMPVYKADAFTRADGSFARAVFFNGSKKMVSLADTQLNVTTDSTWFVVYRLLGDHTTNKDFLGLSFNNCRFGAFFVGTNKLRALNSGVQCDFYLTPLFPELLDSRRSGSQLTVQLDGIQTNTAFGSPVLNTASQFRIGDMLDATTTGYLNADVAELIIYNRALSDTERVIVQNALATRYGLPLVTNNVYAGGDGPQAGFHNEVVGVGSFTSSAYPVVGDVLESANCGGLTLLALGDSLNAGEFVMAGYRGNTNYWIMKDSANQRFEREWYIQKTTTNALGIRLSFDLSTAGVTNLPGATYKLFYRTDRAHTFTGLMANANVAEGMIEFDLDDATFETGCYTLGVGEPWDGVPAAYHAGVTPDLDLWFRASDRVRSSDTSVTNWGNLGFAGDVLDVYGTSELVAQGLVRLDGGYHPVLRFSGSSFLRTHAATDLGIREGMTWFLVFKPTIIGEKGIFGLETPVGVNRFGGWITGGCNFRFQNLVLAQCDLPITAEATYLADCGRREVLDNYHYSAWLNGSVGSLVSTTVLSTPTDYTFAIGRTLSNIPSFIGDIAEVRLYNRALNDAERCIIRNHLAARYGLTLTSDAFYAGTTPANGGCAFDVVGIGCVTNGTTGRFAGVLRASESSAGLSLEALNGSLATDDEFLIAGNNGTTNAWVSAGTGTCVDLRWQREWYLDETTADGVDACLTFTFTDAGIDTIVAEKKPVYRLLWRADVSSDYVDIGVDPERTGASLVFDVSSELLSDGLYTVGASVSHLGTVICVH